MAYSFELARNAGRDVGLPSGVTCGVVGDVIDVATPPLSMSSIIFCTDQFTSGGVVRPITCIASIQLGGTM